jgi:hypothetical protein
MRCNSAVLRSTHFKASLSGRIGLVAFADMHAPAYSTRTSMNMLVCGVALPT